jgi:hypothetical protein|tara:strand:+ start:16 stop:756 length:741 start_codon:yes stop_codon:yes gene_type:complete
MSNYSNSLFSLDKQSPDYLPGRIRLIDHSTRTPKSVTIEELNQINYTGPYTVPDYDPYTQSITWDSTTLCFVVSNVPSDKAAITEDLDTRAQLNEQFLAASALDNVNTTVDYSTYTDSLKSSILSLLARRTFLTLDLVPSFTPPWPATIAEVNEHLNTLFYTNPRSKDLYESFGFVPEVQPISVQKYFTVPSGWNYDPMPDVDFVFYVNPATNLRTLSGVAPPVSGCFPTRAGNLEELIVTDYIFP